MYTIGPDTREVKLVTGSCCFERVADPFFWSLGLKDMPVDRRDKTLEAKEMACGIFSIFVATGLQLRETFVLSLRTKFLLLPPETELGERNVRMSFGEADRVGERLRNVLPPWWSFVLPISSSPNTFQLRRVKRFPVPLTSAAFASVIHFRRISLQ